jgi:hypothetical protein
MMSLLTPTKSKVDHANTSLFLTRKLSSFGYNGGGSLIKSPWVSFLRRPSEVFLPVLWLPTPIRINVVYRLWVVALVITITRSWSFVWFCNFPLLLEFAEMLGLQLTEFCKLFIEL